MGTIYTEFATTPSNWVADVKAAILTSTDWANITGNIVKCTDDAGEQLVVDLQKSGATTQRAGLSVFTSHDGTTGVNEKSFFHFWRTVVSGATVNDPLHIVVSAGKNHLCISSEGPRPGEPFAANIDSGSHKTTFWLGSLEPYFDSTDDPTPAVIVLGANPTDTVGAVDSACYISKDSTGAVFWSTGYLATVVTPALTTLYRQGAWIALDGNTYLFPWVVWSALDGVRGRLKNCFNAGFMQGSVQSQVTDPVNGVGEEFTVGGKTYKCHQIGRTATTATGAAFNGWTTAASTSAQFNQGPLLAIPKD